MKEYTYNIIDNVYDWMISKKKDVEVRILKEKSLAIQPGDYVTFNNLEDSRKYVKVKITNKYIYDNVKELLKCLDVERIMPGHSDRELVMLLEKIYDKDLETKKIVAFEFEYLTSDIDEKIV